MQYLLTEEEMQRSREREAQLRKAPDPVGLQNVCKHVATTMIQTVAVNGGGVSDSPHGCIHVPDPRGRSWQTQYCDGCQVAGICPMPKDYSK